MTKTFHYVVLMDDYQDYFHTSEQLSLLSKFKVYPDYVHRIWTNAPDLLNKHPFIKEWSRYFNILVENLSGFPLPSEDDKVKWGINHENPKRGLAYLSDWYRFLILKKYGGVYSDLDCYSLKRFPFSKIMGSTRYVNVGDLNTVKSEVKCIIGTQISHRYKGTSIHFIAAEPDAPFINQYINIRNQQETGSAQCGFKVLENFESHSTTVIYPETTFSHTIQDKLLDEFTPCIIETIKNPDLLSEFINEFCKSAYELHLPGREGKYLLNRPWMIDFLTALVSSGDQNYS